MKAAINVNRWDTLNDRTIMQLYDKLCYHDKIYVIYANFMH